MRIVKSVEEHVVPDASYPGGEKVAYRLEHWSYPDDKPTDVIKASLAKSQDAAVAASYLVSKLATDHAGEIEKSCEIVGVPVARFWKALLELSGDAVCAPLRAAGLFNVSEADAIYRSRLDAVRNLVAVSKDEDEDEAVEDDETETKSAHEQPGSPDLPHLDADRAKKLPHLVSPAVIESGVSRSAAKILRAAGFESIGPDDQGIEHFLNDVTKSEALLHESGEWAVRSAWDGSITSGENADDMADHLSNTE